LGDDADPAGGAMKPSRAVARPYARAIWELASERNEIEAVGRDLQAVATTLTEQPDLRDLFARPWVPPAAKRAVAMEVTQRLGLSALVRDLVGIAVRHGRADQLEGVAEAFRELVDVEQGRVRARVRTAVPLTPDERQVLQQRLGRKLGAKHVSLDEVVDQRLLGGFVAEVGSYIVDGSLDGQLARLKERLARG
jgi:F-type H+-transporting ATPase subunit delta